MPILSKPTIKSRREKDRRQEVYIADFGLGNADEKIEEMECWSNGVMKQEDGRQNA
jgi:hypothetical protein